MAAQPTFVRTLAHEKWFYDATPLPTRAEQLAALDVFTATAVALVLAATVVGLWFARGRRDVIPGPAELGATPRGRRRFYALVPLVLALHLAVPLFAAALNARLFTPNNALAGPWRVWLGLAQIGAALALVYGAFTRAAAVALAAAWAAGLAVTGVEPMLEDVWVLGFAAFYWLAGRGPLSGDAMLLPRLAPDGSRAHLAVPALRLGVGASMVVLAFTEKLANLPLAEAFLGRHEVNFTAALGIPMTDRTFALCAGAVELLVGLLVMAGAFLRPVVLLAWVPFNASLVVFGWGELIGHLPFYAALGVLLVYTGTPEDRALFARAVGGRPVRAVAGRVTTLARAA